MSLLIALYRFNLEYNWGAEDDEGSVNWGIYYNGSSWVQATTGYIKVDLWK